MNIFFSGNMSLTNNIENKANVGQALSAIWTLFLWNLTLIDIVSSERYVGFYDISKKSDIIYKNPLSTNTAGNFPCCYYIRL